MWEIIGIIFLVLCVVLIGLAVFLFLRGKKEASQAYKKGSDDLFKLILQSGFEKRVEDFRTYNTFAKKGKIVFVGDSITEQYNVYEYFKGMDVYNRGIGGDTTVGLAKRLKESVYDLDPSVVVLMVGTNDFGLIENTTPNSLAKRIEDIVSSIQKELPKCQIILESIYPVYEKDGKKIDRLSVSSRTNEQIRQTNELLKKIKGVHYLDVNSNISTKDGNVIYDYTVEGLHINSTGYIFITELIKEAIRSL